jgi:cytochrome c oxidase assembly protein subunit 15
MNPSWLSAFEDMATIQFNHRMFAYLLTIFIVIFAIVLLGSNVPRFLKNGTTVLLFVLSLQVVLGISTLLFYIPIPVAAAHQVGAIALLSVSLFITHSCLSREQI